jgi:hypothetical protein
VCVCGGGGSDLFAVSCRVVLCRVLLYHAAHHHDDVPACLPACLCVHVGSGFVRLVLWCVGGGGVI